VDTTKGRIVFKLRTDLAPKHARIKQLARDVFYDNVPFHRVMDASWHRPATARISTAPAVRNIQRLSGVFQRARSKRGIVGDGARCPAPIARIHSSLLFARCALPERPIHLIAKWCREWTWSTSSRRRAGFPKRQRERPRQDGEGASRIPTSVSAGGGGSQLVRSALLWCCCSGAGFGWTCRTGAGQYHP